jgi:hypothetical protein
MTYSEKLKDPRWQKKRLHIFQRDGFACTNCHDDQKTLHVHHKKYSSNPWESKDGDLVTLCAECHDYETNVRSGIKDFFNSAETFHLDFLLENINWFKSEIGSSPLDINLLFEVLNHGVDDLKCAKMTGKPLSVTASEVVDHYLKTKPKS